MRVPDNISIRTAVTKSQKFNLDASHRTTMDFMLMQPVYYRHMIPGQSISVDVRSFIRMAPMPVPSFADASLHLHAFFVPYKQVCPYFQEFITDSVYIPHNQTSAFVPTQVPMFNNIDLVSALTESTLFTTAAATGYDILVKTGTNTSQGYVFTSLGRAAFKMLTSLGYRFKWSRVIGDNYSFNALPLLSLLHVYLDYFWPNQYRNLPEYKTLDSFLRIDSGAYRLTKADLIHILQVLPVMSYDNDYFTAAYDNPLGPNDGNSSSFIVHDNASGDYDANEIATYAYAQGDSPVPAITSDSEEGKANPYAITQNSLNWLQRITDYMRRHQIAGSRSLERFLARYGVKPNSLVDGRAIKLGQSVVPMTILDQMSTASTSDAQLGDYAGKGYIMDTDKLPHFTYKSDSDFGIFFVLASLVPKIGYVQGVDRHNLETSKDSFYNPEFDALGCQGISKAELYVPFDGTKMPTFDFNGIFGFIPRDAHRKVGKDWLSGDYILGSKNQAGDVSAAWHSYRLFSSFTFGDDPANIVHSSNFVFGKDRAQFDRLFYNTTDSADHFYCDFFFNVVSYAPMKPLFDFVDFDDDEHNKSVVVDTKQNN